MGPLSWLAHTPVLGRLPLTSAAGTVWSTLAVVAAATGLAGALEEEPREPARATLATTQLRDASDFGSGGRAGRHPQVRERGRADAPGAPVADESADEPSPGEADPPATTPGPGSPGAEDRPRPDREPPEREPDEDPRLIPDNSITDPVVPPIDVMTVNEAPSFTAGADQAVFEDAGPRTVAGWATGISPGPPSQSGQSVTFSASNDAAPLFAAQPEVHPNGTLRFTTAADASGSATVTVRAVDDGGTANGGNDTSAPQTFALAVTALNDAPEFTPGASQSVPEDAGAQTVSGWATGIATGPSDESGQSVVFVVGNDSPGLFAVQPEVAPDGTLTYTPAADASGTATVTVEAVDDGGNADGGSDTSAAQTFTIAVSEVNEAPSFAAGPNQLVQVDSGPQTVAGWATAISPGWAARAARGSRSA